MNQLHSETPRRAGQAGFTLVELSVAGTILLFLCIAVGRLVDMGGRAQDYARRLNRVTEVGQNLMDDMRAELLSSVMFFGNDTLGNDSLALLDLSAAPPVLSASLRSSGGRPSVARRKGRAAFTLTVAPRVLHRRDRHKWATRDHELVTAVQQSLDADGPIRRCATSMRTPSPVAPWPAA